MKRQHIMAGSAIGLVLAFVVAMFGYSWLQVELTRFHGQLEVLDL